MGVSGSRRRQARYAAHLSSLRQAGQIEYNYSKDRLFQMLLGISSLAYIMLAAAAKGDTCLRKLVASW